MQEREVDYSVEVYFWR